MPSLPHDPQHHDAEFILKDGGGLRLQGDWVFAHAVDIAHEMDSVTAPPTAIDGTGITGMDTAGAFLLQQLADKHGAIRLTDRQQHFLDYLKDTRPPAQALAEAHGNKLVAAITKLGEKTVNGFGLAKDLVSFVGLVAVRMAHNVKEPRRFRLNSIIHQIELTGLHALPIVALLAILISMVIFYQGAIQLQRFGADLFTIDLTVISLLREMGVLVTAIIVAGRSGSAFAAEIGVMKLREEIDALRTMGMHPVEVLVIPRVIALMITLPLLTFLADFVGLAGGSVMAISLLDIQFGQYLDRVDYVAKPTMFFVGMIKAPVFAFIIAVIGTYQGMKVEGSAEEVGRRTTVAVVQSIFLVIMADALFSILFAQLGI